MAIAAIFGTDLAGSSAGAAIAAHLRGLLSGDPRLYLAGELVHG
jgi:hypothetical protein